MTGPNDKGLQETVDMKGGSRDCRERFIDCYGKHFYEKEIAVHADNQRFIFVFDPSLKHGKPFEMGLFFDDVAVCTRACFRYPRERRICILRESPILSVYKETATLESRYRHVFTFDKGLLDKGKPYSLLYYGTNWIGWEQAELHEIPQKSKLVSFIANITHEEEGGYAFRRKIAQALLSIPEVDCFGKGIQWIESKRSVLEPYRFSIALENIQKDYYFSEKLVDCFLTYSVPIYWGCPAISELFDPRGMILFSTLDDLHSIINSLSIEKYDAMFPYLKKNRETAISLRVHNTTGYFSRVTDSISHSLASRGPLPKPARSKAAAALRCLWETTINR